MIDDSSNKPVAQARGVQAAPLRLEHSMTAPATVAGAWRPASEPVASYRSRFIRSLGEWQAGRNRFKFYGLTLEERPPRPGLVSEAMTLAAQRTNESPLGYGVGWIVAHEGEDGDYVLVDWWTEGGIVQHHLHGAPRGGRLRHGWPEGAGFCVWELAIACHERTAWIRHVLARADAPDWEGYFADTLEGWL